MKNDNQKIKKLLDEAISKDLSPENRGEIYANFALVYLRAINKLNGDYERVLDGAIAMLKSAR
jgi:hypothetical protein